MNVSQSNLARGFSAALWIPAIASSIKQTQREAERELHILAQYFQRARDEEDRGRHLDFNTRQAAHRFAQAILEQTINGTTFFVAVQLGVLLAGPLGGMLAQLAITGNTIVTPQQTQRINPAKMLFGSVDYRPDALAHMPESFVQRFAYYSGQFADWCGYGYSQKSRNPKSVELSSRIQLEFSAIPAPANPFLHRT
jgi:hypothetical protein